MVAPNRGLFGKYRDRAGFWKHHLETLSLATRQLRMLRCRLHVWQIRNAAPNY
jgi:hypothetical protein